MALVRSCALAVCLAALVGCTTLSTLDGARTLDPGQVQVASAVSVQGGTNAISRATGIPVGQVELGARYGVVEHVDIGARIYVGGALVDVRYRFAQRGPWHFAVAPGIGGLPAPRVGRVDVRGPIRAQRALGESWDVTVGLTPAARFTPGLGDVELFVGGATRVEYHRKRLVLGVSVDLVGQPSLGVRPAFSAGLDVGWRLGTQRTRDWRAARRQR